MDRKTAFMLMQKGVPSESVSGIGYTAFYPTNPSSILDAVIIGNTQITNKAPIYPQKSEFIHSGDPVSVEGESVKYCFNLRTHGRCWLDLFELKRLCEKNLPGLFVSEDSEYINLKCSSEFDGREILTPSDAVFAPSMYTVFASILPPSTYTSMTCHMNIIIYLENDAGELMLTVLKKGTGKRSYKGQTPAAVPPHRICYKHKNTQVELITLAKSDFAMIEFNSENPPAHAEAYNGENRSVFIDEPLRSLEDTDGSICADEYSLAKGVVTRKIKEITLDGNTAFSQTSFENQKVFFASLKDNPAYPLAASAASCFVRAEHPNSLIGTEYHFAIGASGKQIYFTLPSEYTSVERAKEFFSENPVNVIYKLATQRKEYAEKYIPNHAEGYTVFEAAATQRPRIKLEYTT